MDPTVAIHQTLAGHTLWGTKPFSGDALLVDTSLFSPLLSEELWYRPVPPRGASAEEKQLLCSFRSDCVRARPGRRTHYSKSAPQELMGIAWPVGSIVTRVVADAGGFRAIASAVLLLSSGTAVPLAN